MIKILGGLLAAVPALISAAAGEGEISLATAAGGEVVISATELQELLDLKASNTFLQGTTASLPPFEAYGDATWERTLKIPQRVPFELTIAPTGGAFGDGAQTIQFSVSRGGRLQATVVSQFQTALVQGLRWTAATSSSSTGYLEILMKHRNGQTHPAQIRCLRGPIPASVAFVNLGQDMDSEGFVSDEIMMGDIRLQSTESMNAAISAAIAPLASMDILSRALHDSTADNWCAYKGGFYKDTHAIYTNARFMGKSCNEICNLAADEVNGDSPRACLAGNTRIAPPYFHGQSQLFGAGSGRWGSYYWSQGCNDAAHGNGATYCCCTW